MGPHIRLALTFSICIVVTTVENADAIFRKLWTWRPWRKHDFQVTSPAPPHNVSHRPLDDAYRVQLTTARWDLRDLQQALRLIQLKWNEMCDDGVEIKMLDSIVNETEGIVKKEINLIDARLDEDNGSIEMTDPISKLAFGKLTANLMNMKRCVQSQPQKYRKNPELVVIRNYILDAQKQFNKASSEMAHELGKIKRKKSWKSE